MLLSSDYSFFQYARNNISFFSLYFLIYLYFRSQIAYSFVKFGYSIYFSRILQICNVEVRIYRSISESPLDFEITRVGCTNGVTQGRLQSRSTAFLRHRNKKETRELNKRTVSKNNTSFNSYTYNVQKRKLTKNK